MSGRTENPLKEVIVCKAQVPPPVPEAGEVMPYRPGYEMVKRIVDVAICLLLLPLAATISAVCAVFIWIENPGPVVFTQMRTGQGGRRFRLFKLRTMVVDAESPELKQADLNESTWPDFKSRRDPRVTSVGRFLRKTSLDELPQLINVLRGDMSLVGPRPTSFEASTYSLWQTERLEVLPGMTGLWQIAGRSDIDFDHRVCLDVAYIRSRSLLLDFQILLLTIPAVLRQRGAH